MCTFRFFPADKYFYTILLHFRAPYGIIISVTQMIKDKEVQERWQSVRFAARVLPLALRFPIRTDVPTVPGSPTFAVLRLSLTALRAISMFALGASVPARLPAQSDLQVFGLKKQALCCRRELFYCRNVGTGGMLPVRFSALGFSWPGARFRCAHLPPAGRDLRSGKVTRAIRPQCQKNAGIFLIFCSLLQRTPCGRTFAG